MLTSHPGGCLPVGEVGCVRLRAVPLGLRFLRGGIVALGVGADHRVGRVRGRGPSSLGLRVDGAGRGCLLGEPALQLGQRPRCGVALVAPRFIVMLPPSSRRPQPSPDCTQSSRAAAS